jgi:cytochrome c oxidase cbb3-type subunit 3
MSTPMMRRFDARLMVALALGAALSTALGCERDASGLTEWTPADHDHQAEPRMRRTMANMAQKANPHSAPGQKNQVIDVTWLKQCATCHGKRGKGDGPSSTMVKARDLTNAEFQATLSDEQMAQVIRQGKDKMPAFNLPDSIIEGLVQHVRGMVKKKLSGPDDGSEPDVDDNDAPEPAPSAEAQPAAPNAPASTGSVSAPSPSASPAAPARAADKAPQAPTQTPPAGTPPTAAPHGAKPSPAQPSNAPAPSAPHP